MCYAGGHNWKVAIFLNVRDLYGPLLRTYPFFFTLGLGFRRRWRMEMYGKLEGTVVHQPLSISICISTLFMPHTTLISPSWKIACCCLHFRGVINPFPSRGSE